MCVHFEDLATIVTHQGGKKFKVQAAYKGQSLKSLVNQKQGGSGEGGGCLFNELRDGSALVLFWACACIFVW